MTAHERGWSTLANGDLLDRAETVGFEVFVTTDSNLRHQQIFAGRRIAIVVLATTSWPRMQRAVHVVVRAIDGATDAGYTEVLIS